MNITEIRAAYTDDVLVQIAEQIMLERMNASQIFQAPNEVKAFLRFNMGSEQREHFAIMFLDAQHRLIKFERMFSGTNNQTSVYPREVARQALLMNAAALILAHNHPSGNPEPSFADEALTKEIKKVCDLISVRVLDHFVVSATSTVSFAERGLM